MNLNNNKMKDWTKGEATDTLFNLLSVDERYALVYHDIDEWKTLSDLTVEELGKISMGLEGFCGEDPMHALEVLTRRANE